MEAVNNPEDASAGHAQGAVLARALHRAGRFSRRSAQAVFPPLAGPRSAAALRLLHHLHGRGEERRGRGDRDPLHLRSGDARRQRARWAQGEVDHPLGIGRRTRSTPKFACTKPVHARESERGRARAGFHREPESELARSAHRRKLEPSLAGAAPGAAISSSGWATSASIRTPRPASLVFNRTVALRDTWAKIEKREKGGK